jgi:cytochrome b561
MHIWASLALAAIVGLHIAGALKHWLVNRDGVLERIVRPGVLSDSRDTRETRTEPRP